MNRFLGKRALCWIIPLAMAATACAAADNDENDGIGGGSDIGGSTAGGGVTSAGGSGGGNFVTTTTDTTTTTTSTGGMGGMGGNAGTGGSGGGMMLPDPNDYPVEVETNGTLGSANAFQTGTLGFQASLSSANDVDIFSIDAPLGATMRVAISDGFGGCPADANVFVQVYSPDNLELVSETSLCPVLDGNTYPALASLGQAGKYFIRVSATGAPVSLYVVELSVDPPVCGDGIPQLGEECDDGNMTAGDGCENDCTLTPVCPDSIVETGEECDDGNSTNGDGCDSSCQLEGNFCPEGEPNNTFATATLLTTCTGGAGQISVVGDVDYYKFVIPTAGSSLRAEITDVLGTPNTCPASFDSKIYLYDASMTQIGLDDDDGMDACSIITPANDPFATNLPAGTYFIKVEEYNNDGTSPPYILSVGVLAPGCGDLITQTGEQCDDGNTVSGDGCSATCQIEGNYCAQQEVNDNIASATPITSMCADGASGIITPIGDKDFFSFTVSATDSSVRAQITNVTGSGCPAFDSVLRLYNSAGTEIGSDDNDGVSPCSLINPITDSFARNLPVGTYYLSVEEGGNNAVSQPYLLKVQVNPPGCGDHILQAGESCDDGNTLDNDGCDSMCQIEGDFCSESEPNDNFLQASPITTCDGGTGSIGYVTDADWYSFQVTVPLSSARLEVTDVVGSGCPMGFDSNIRLFNSAMMQLGTDNDDGADACSLITPVTDAFARNLSVGTYYVRVEENGNDATSPAYVLLVDVNPPGCGDGVVQTGEQCDDGNTTDGDGCSSTCTLLTCAPGETLVTLDSTDVPKTILDNAPTTPALSTINVAQTGTVTQIAVRVNVAHSWMGDVQVYLDPPGATPADISLVDNIGGSNDNMTDTLFSSIATTNVTTGTPPWTGVWAPQGAGGFTSVIGTPSAGAWTLRALDNAAGIAGTLTGYSLYMCVAP